MTGLVRSLAALAAAGMTVTGILLVGSNTLIPRSTDANQPDGQEAGGQVCVPIAPDGEEPGGEQPGATVGVGLDASTEGGIHGAATLPNETNVIPPPGAAPGGLPPFPMPPSDGAPTLRPLSTPPSGAPPALPFPPSGGPPALPVPPSDGLPPLPVPPYSGEPPALPLPPPSGGPPAPGMTADLHFGASAEGDAHAGSN